MSNTITEQDLENMYEEMLDENYGVVSVAGSKFYTSVLLKNADPVAYRAGMADYADSLMEDGYTVEGYQ